MQDKGSFPLWIDTWGIVPKSGMDSGSVMRNSLYCTLILYSNVFLVSYMETAKCQSFNGSGTGSLYVATGLSVTFFRILGTVSALITIVVSFWGLVVDSG